MPTSEKYGRARTGEGRGGRTQPLAQGSRTSTSHPVSTTSTTPRDRGPSSSARSPPAASTSTNPCICNWPECGQLRKIFKDQNHPYFSGPRGRCVEVKLSTTRDTANFIRAACRNLHVPPDLKRSLLAEVDSSTQNGDRARTRSAHSAGGHKKWDRISIAPHHFPIGMHKMKEAHEGKWSWVKPIERKNVEKFGCLPRNYRGDVLL